MFHSVWELERFQTAKGTFKGIVDSAILNYYAYAQLFRDNFLDNFPLGHFLPTLFG